MDKLIAADISHGEYETYIPALMEKFEDMSKEDILKRVAALEFNHFLKYYENAEDLNARIHERAGARVSTMENRDSNKGARGFARRDNGYTRLFINVGTKDGFYKASFLQFILDESNLKKDALGKIDLREMNSWVEIDKMEAVRMIKALDGKMYNNRIIRMNEADGGFKSARGSKGPRG